MSSSVATGNASDSSSVFRWEDWVTFYACCSFFEMVSAERKKEKKTAMLGRFLADCRKVSAASKSASLFPIMRLILPQLDRDRRDFGLQENRLADAYADFLGLGRNSGDAARLRNYRDPARNCDAAGDFGAVLYSVVVDRWPNHNHQKTMSVGRLNDGLEAIAAGNGREGEVLKDLFRETNAAQQKWLARIILKEMRLGIGTITALRQFHPDANEFSDVNVNGLRAVCQKLIDPEVRLPRNQISISLLNAFRPMLADRCPLGEVTKTMGEKPFYIEVKYDGERMLVHKDGNDYRFFSRNGFDFTRDFGRSASERGKFSSYLADCLMPSVDSVILDGEICAFNRHANALAQKSEQMNIRTLGNNPLYQQCLCVYDMVYLNGEVLTNEPLKRRLKLMASMVRENPGRIQFAERKEASTQSEVVEALNDAIDRREEGIVVKDPDSSYKPNGRTKSGWVKIKPDYSGSLMDQCDLIIMGGYYGTGRRGGGFLTHFLLGLAKKNGKDLPTEFHSFCRVGSGYSGKELFELLQKLQPHFTKNRPTNCEFMLDFGREKPDLYIDPRQSVLLQVKAAEIVANIDHTAGCTLRYPRVEKVRYDKSWHECMTLTELEALQTRGKGKLANRQVGDGDCDFLPPAEKRRRRPLATESSLPRVKTVAVASIYKAVDVSKVAVKTRDLEGKVLVIEPCNAELKTRLEEVVRKLGGTCEQNVSANTHCYVETGYKVRAKSVVKAEKWDVVKSKWLLECSQKFRPFRPSDMIFTTPQTSAAFRITHDRYGDGYCDLVTEESMRFSFAMVALLGESKKDVSIADVVSQYFTAPYKYGLFSPFVIYLDINQSGDGQHQLDLVGMTVRLYGGQIAKEIDNDRVTHAIVHKQDMARLIQLRDVRRRRKKKFHIVSEMWVESCLAHVEVLDEIHFEL